ncbi:vicilin-like seed storage protein At2g18540 isoform X2 [Colletotrichum tofieldiae]|nr:vicilin-like seed storage protein At2g18540 isoform X2 [Colletotrichum tofieldiae]GKT71044.1 vicilin-like seed storage protein At2g18540 isoform X2 [Colletotrichum tofieldiae]GKT94037.1 vicilin-like seed storage protein At2g18540 isoform X2 [Colletotrichum tofieldiae]
MPCALPSPSTSNNNGNTQELLVEFERLRAQDNIWRVEKEGLETQILALEAEKNKLLNENKEANSRVKSLIASNARHFTSVEHQRRNERDKAQQESKMTQSQLNEAQEEIKRLRSDNIELRVENLTLQAQRSAAEDCRRLRIQYDTLQADNQRLVFEIRALRTQIGIHLAANTRT